MEFSLFTSSDIGRAANIFYPKRVVVTDAESMKAQILAQHPNADVIFCQIGPVIGINTGINTMATIYLGEERK